MDSRKGKGSTTDGNSGVNEADSDLKREIIRLLHEEHIDLKKLYSEEYLGCALSLLEDLLEEEKDTFAMQCALTDDELTFDKIYTDSLLSLYFGLLRYKNGVFSDDLTRSVIEKFQPKYVAFSNEMTYSKRYYSMTKTLLNTGSLDKEQQRILEKRVETVEILGINLLAEQQEELKKINTKSSMLATRFRNNIKDDKSTYTLYLDDESSIRDMPNDDKKRAREAAKKDNLDGYMFDASRGSYTAIMKYCDDRDVRKKMYDDFGGFASSGEFDNRALILEMLQLNHKKAKLLGYDTYACLSLKQKMASSPEEVMTLLREIQAKGTKRAREEFSEMENFFGLAQGTISYHDIAYYMRKYKEEKFNLDETVLKQYFEFEQTLSGMLDIATKLYGVTFQKIVGTGFEYSDDVRVFSVQKDGQLVSYFLCDFFYRPEKNSGAWANVIRSRFGEGQEKIYPIVINTSNLQKNDHGVTLLSESEITTMFHEFGHGLHELLSTTQYAELTGFGVEWDFVELPSQLMENWSKEAESLQTFARHHETKELIPTDLLDKLKEKSQFGKGYFLSRQGELGLLDMMLYSSDIPETVGELDDKILGFTNSLSVFPREETYKMYAGFSHIFGGGYSAGYYSYIRAEIVEAQVLEVFKERGMFDTRTANDFLETILGAGSQEKADVMFEKFMGEGVSRNAYLRKYGLEE